MHGVDEIEISPHETIGAIHGIEPPAQDAAPRVKSPARRQTAALQFLVAHAAGLEGNAVVAVAIVQPPRVVEQAAFALQAAIQRRAGKRREMIEGGDIKRVLLREIDRLLEALRRVSVITENECAVDANAMAPEIF